MDYKNRELYDHINNFEYELKPEYINFLNDILGELRFDVQANENTRVRVENNAKKAKAISENAKISLEGPPELADILNVAKLKLAADQAFKKIAEINDDKNVNRKKIESLDGYSEKNKFLKKYNLTDDVLVTSTHEEISKTANETKQKITDKLKSEFENNKNNLQEKINENIEKVENIITESEKIKNEIEKALLEIKEKQDEIQELILRLKSNLVAAKGRKDELEISSLQEDIDQKNAESQVLLVCSAKLINIESKLEKQLNKAPARISTDYKKIVDEINNLSNDNLEVLEDFEKKSLQIDAMLEDLKDEMERFKKVIHLAHLATLNPEHQLYAKKPVNAFVEILSLADIDSFDENGEPYFLDEILSEETQKPSEKDPRTRFGLEAQLIYRGIDLSPGEFKRSSYVAFTRDGKKDTSKQLAVETRVEHPQEIGQVPRVKIDYIAKGDLDDREKQLGALRFAKEILHLYNEGDKKNPIVIRAGNGQKLEDVKEHAAYVYAAILMLTSPDPKNPNSNYVKLPKDMLKIEVPGIDGPALLQWPWKRKEEFIKKYFVEDELADLRNNFTKQYRDTRQSLEKGQSSIDPNSADDICTDDIENRLKYR